MDSAKKYNNNFIDITYIEIYIRELAEETGVSMAFIEAARPLIEKAFSDVSPENRDVCLNQIRDIVQGQSETEAQISRAKEAASKLKKAQIEHVSNLSEIQKQNKQIKETRHRVSFSLVNAFSGRPAPIIKA